METFIISQTSRWKYYFVYKLNNGSSLIESYEYSSKKECERWVDATKNFGSKIENYTKQKLPNGYFFEIRANNNEVLASSGIFTSKAFIDQQIKALIPKLATTEVHFESLEDKIEEQEKTIQKKNETITKTSEQQSKGMLEIFQGLQKDFALEERIWLMFWYMIFSILLAITSSIVSIISPILSAFVNFIFLIALAITIDLSTKPEKSPHKYRFDEWITILFFALAATVPLLYFWHESWIIFTKSWESWTKIMDPQNMKWEFIAPISILFFSLFWFSVHQYGRAKKLRIEQQNKQAMIHFMQAIVASDGKWSTENRLFPQLAPFFANAIIHRPFSQDNYDPQLPIDEVKKVLDMAKLFQK